MEGAHYSSFAARRGFKTEQELEDWIIGFYAERLAYYTKNMGKTSIYGVKITPALLRTTRSRYLTLLMRKYNVTNGQLPTINK